MFDFLRKNRAHTDAVTQGRERILNAGMETFAFPHLVVDDLFPVALLDQMNRAWPNRAIFHDEVPGNHVASDPRADRATIKFWRPFANVIWPSIVAACVERFASITERTMPGLAPVKAPLMLMEADERFAGHDRHTHFYHNPNWVLTALFYADTEDTTSPGTTISRLPGLNGNYDEGATDRAAGLAIRTLQWCGMGDVYEDQEIAYVPNRLLVFLDGPLAFHSVVGRLPQRGRRRILRTHVSVKWEKFSRRLLNGIDQPSYREMTKPEGPWLTGDFVRERIHAYSAAIKAGSR